MLHLKETTSLFFLASCLLMIGPWIKHERDTRNCCLLTFTEARLGDFKDFTVYQKVRTKDSCVLRREDLCIEVNRPRDIDVWVNALLF